MGGESSLLGQSLVARDERQHVEVVEEARPAVEDTECRGDPARHARLAKAAFVMGRPCRNSTMVAPLSGK